MGNRLPNILTQHKVKYTSNGILSPQILPSLVDGHFRLYIIEGVVRSTKPYCLLLAAGPELSLPPPPDPALLPEHLIDCLHPSKLLEQISLPR